MVIQLPVRVKWPRGGAVGIILIGSDNLYATLHTGIAAHWYPVAERHVDEALDGVLARPRVRLSRPFMPAGRLLTGKHRLGFCEVTGGGRHMRNSDRFHILALALGAGRRWHLRRAKRWISGRPTEEPLQT